MDKPKLYQRSLTLFGLILGLIVAITFFGMVQAALAPWKPTASAPTGRTWSAITAAQSSSCGISAGTLYCWGSGDRGRLGEGSSGGITVLPSAVQGGVVGKTVTSVALGTAHGCAVTNEATNNLYCWGLNQYGQVGNNSTANQTTSIKIAGSLVGKTVTAVSAGDSSTCALTTEATANVYCWGYGGQGRLGDNNAAAHNVLTPWQVNTGSLTTRQMVKLSVGGGHVCAIGSGGGLNCWGWNANGQIGNNSTADVLVPLLVGTGQINGQPLLRVASGQSHTCAIISDATVWCWGSNTYGQLGLSNRTDSLVPANTGAGNSQEITAGYGSNCIRANTTTWCWGMNYWGQVGNASRYDALAVTNIQGYTDYGVLAGKQAGVLGLASPTSSSHCMINTDQMAACWGANSWGNLGNGRIAYDPTPNVPVPVNPAISKIVSGAEHSCAINKGEVYCWGQNSSGQLGTGDNISSNVPRKVSQVNGVLASQVIDISAGSAFTCALRQNLTVACWGNNQYGQLGNGTITNSNVPLASNTGAAVVTLKSSNTYTCVTVNDASTDNLWCWGENYFFGLGRDASVSYSTTAVNIANGTLAGKKVVATAPGPAVNCAVTADGTMHCWGNNNSGQYGNGTTGLGGPTPVQVTMTGELNGLTIYPIASSGWLHTCAVASNKRLYCWGRNVEGQLGINTTEANRTLPAAVYTGGALGGVDIAQVSSNQEGTCVRSTTGKAYCWGKNDVGQVGNGNTATPVIAPAAVSTSGVLASTNLMDISYSVQAGTVCATNGTYAYCWGLNGKGQLGNGITGTNSSTAVYVKLQIPLTTTAYRFYNNTDSLTPGSPLAGNNTPTQLPAKQAFRLRTNLLAGKVISQISGGSNHTCAITSEGKAYCWGGNASGQLGNGTNTASSLPVAVSTSGVLAGKVLVYIAAGDNTACALDSAGQAYCWGDNWSGQLGNGNTTASNVPVAVSQSGLSFTQITAGAGFACALATDGKSYCWGWNYYYQLGTATDSIVPTATDISGVLAGKTLKSISAGDYHVCALSADNVAYCWGRNGNGRLGDGTPVNAVQSPSLPVIVNLSALSTNDRVVKQVVAAGSHSCLLNSLGKVYCWGTGGSGEIGDGAMADRATPSAVDTSGVLNGKIIAKISLGTATSYAFSADGQVYAWGVNDAGEIGYGTTGWVSTPVAVDTSGVLSGKTIQGVYSGAHQACVLGSSMINVYCWGKNDVGQVGDGTSGTNRLSPVVANISSLGLSSYSMLSGDNTFKLQFAQKNAATCATSTGYADITTTTAIAWNTNPSVTNNSAITTTTNDPTPSATTTPQTYQSAAGPFGTTDIPAGNSALWDFSLQDYGAPANTTYCFRIVYGDGTDLTAATQGSGSYAVYPELTTAGDLSVSIVDASGALVPSPSFPLAGTVVKTQCQSTNGIFGTDSQRIRVSNPRATNGWSLSVAASAGPTDLWSTGDGLYKYDFNDANGWCNDSTDPDTYGGVLTMTTDFSTVTPQSGYSSTGITKGAVGYVSFNEGTTNAINLLSANNTSSLGAYWDLTNVSLQQWIPKAQPAGNYTLNLRVTVVAN